MSMRWGRLLAAALVVALLPPLAGYSAATHGAHAALPVPGTGRAGAAHRAGAPPRSYPVDSWPTYLSNPERTGANLGERTLAVSNASNLSIFWSIKTNGSGFGSPTIVNGTVFAGAWDGYEYALNASTGHILWKADLGTDPNCSWGSPMGVDGSAAVWNGTVFVGGGDDFWYALNATNGSVDWRVKVGDNSPSGGNFNWASPLLYNGSEYIGVASCIDSPLVQGKLLMVNLTGTHSVLHSFDFVPNGQTGGTIWTTSAVDPATGRIWVATGNDDGSSNQPLTESIVALNASNLSLVGHWQVPGVVGTDSDFGAGPTLFNDSSGTPLVAALNKNGVLYALNRTNVTNNGSWKPVWSLTTSGEFSPAAFDGSTLYDGGGSVTIGSASYSGSILAIDPGNGTVRWTHGSPSLVTAGLAYANGLVVDGSGSTLEVLDAANGTALKTFSLASGQTIEGAPSLAQGRIFFESGDFSSTGYFYAIGLPLGLSGNETPATGSAPLGVRFTGNPTGGMPPYNFSWAFGDGTGGYGSPAFHQYVTGGAFNITLEVRDAANATRNVSLQVVIGAPLTTAIELVPSNGVAPLTVSFTAVAQYGAGAPYNFTWAFGDGSSPSYAATTSHQYRTAGDYTVSLQTRDAVGHMANATARVGVGAPLSATAHASTLSGPAPLQVLFTASAANGSSPYRFTWSFGDQSPDSTQSTVDHTFLQPGNFTTKLAVRDQTNTVVTESFQISVGAPLASALSSPVQSAESCPAHLIVVTVHATASGGAAPYSYAWEFGDGSSNASAGATVAHNYSANGTYAVNVTVRDANGVLANASTSTTIVLTACPSTGGHGPPPLPSKNSSGGIPEVEWLGAGLIVGAAGVVATVWLATRRGPPAPPEP
jgi:PKD repeat protein/outer membrane protein assembly factor BamB